MSSKSGSQLFACATFFAISGDIAIFEYSIDTDQTPAYLSETSLYVGKG